MQNDSKINELRKQYIEAKEVRQLRELTLERAQALAQLDDVGNFSEMQDLLRRCQWECSEAEQRVAALSQQIVDEEKRSKEWQPYSGIGYTYYGGGTVEVAHEDGMAQSGLTFPTKEAAQIASSYSRWFRLLLNLAAQLNPSGKPAVRQYQLWFNPGDKEWQPYGGISCEAIFENREAAQKACDILNRQNGVLAGVPCPGAPQ